MTADPTPKGQPAEALSAEEEAQARAVRVYPHTEHAGLVMENATPGVWATLDHERKLAGKSSGAAIALQVELDATRAELAVAVEALRWALDHIADGVTDNVPDHECEFATNPENGACDFHEEWVDARATLASLSASAAAYRREAEARGLERGAEIAEGGAVEVGCPDKGSRRSCHVAIAAALRAEAARVREGRDA